MSKKRGKLLPKAPPLYDILTTYEVWVVRGTLPWADYEFVGQDTNEFGAKDLFKRCTEDYRYVKMIKVVQYRSVIQRSKP